MGRSPAPLSPIRHHPPHLPQTHLFFFLVTKMAAEGLFPPTWGTCRASNETKTLFSPPPREFAHQSSESKHRLNVARESLTSLNDSLPSCLPVPSRTVRRCRLLPIWPPPGGREWATIRLSWRTGSEANKSDWSLSLSLSLTHTQSLSLSHSRSLSVTLTSWSG